MGDKEKKTLPSLPSRHLSLGGTPGALVGHGSVKCYTTRASITLNTHARLPQSINIPFVLCHIGLYPILLVVPNQPS